MTDEDLQTRISRLVEEEHALREQLAAGEISADEERARLTAAEEQLDRAWDLLRQRRARRDAGDDPERAEPRPVEEVEGYLQ